MANTVKCSTYFIIKLLKCTVRACGRHFLYKSILTCINISPVGSVGDGASVLLELEGEIALEGEVGAHAEVLLDGER